MWCKRRFLYKLDTIILFPKGNTETAIGNTLQAFNTMCLSTNLSKIMKNILDWVLWCVVHFKKASWVWCYWDDNVRSQRQTFSRNNVQNQDRTQDHHWQHYWASAFLYPHRQDHTKRTQQHCNWAYLVPHERKIVHFPRGKQPTQSAKAGETNLGARLCRSPPAGT